MRKRILISPNSYKECADSVTIAELMRNNLSILKNTELITKPVSDGGDGFLNVCRFYFGGEIRKYPISTAYNESKFECPVLYCESKKEIYIESAEVVGLKVIPISYRNPLKLSSKGLGEILLKIREETLNNTLNVERVFIGIGGTATIDMGIGMLSILGLSLLDSSGYEFNVIPDNYSLAKRFDYKPVKFPFEIIPIVDVNNTLFGEKGGIRVFGQQKGVDEKNIVIFEKSFNHLLNLFENNSLRVYSNLLSGAGGGIPAAFQIFFDISLIQSSDFIKDHLGLKNYLVDVDHLITGEGAFDAQSNFGKGAGILVELFKEQAKSIFLVCGRISKKNVIHLPKNVYPIEISDYFFNQDESITNYKEGIEKACKEIIKELNF